MKHSDINDRLNYIIKKHIPEGIKLVPFIMDLLSISKESAYRRLRSEIPYTMQEAAIIMSELDIYPEEVFENSPNSNKVCLSFNTLKEVSPSENYVFMMNKNIKDLKEVSEYQYTKAFFVGNKIPNGLLLHYKMLSKLRYIKWIHQTHNLAISSKFSEIVVPPEVLESHQEYLELSKGINHFTGIFDFNFIQSIISTIKFYYHRNLITDEELNDMKNELHDLLDKLEYISRTGKNIYGTDHTLYLSYLHIESNTILFEFDDKMSVHLFASGTDSFVTNNIKVCKNQKLWIESLLKFSVLITRSNEILQAGLFSRQRKLLEEQLSLPLKTDSLY